MSKAFALALLLGLALPIQAQAIRCSKWTRLSPAEKQATIFQMIETGVQSSRARRYNINPARTQRCLQQNATNIEFDFDGVCADRGRAVQALNNVFKSYAWSCIQ